MVCSADNQKSPHATAAACTRPALCLHHSFHITHEKRVFPSSGVQLHAVTMLQNTSRFSLPQWTKVCPEEAGPPLHYSRPEMNHSPHPLTRGLGLPDILAKRSS